MLNYQTLVSEVTGLEVANASLLDEGTAAAEAMTLCTRHNKRKKLYISDKVHPQTLEVVRTRTDALDLQIIVGPIDQCDLASRELSGILLQYPDTTGNVRDFADIAKEANKNGVSSYCNIFDDFSIQITLWLILILFLFQITTDFSCGCN